MCRVAQLDCLYTLQPQCSEMCPCCINYNRTAAHEQLGHVSAPHLQTTAGVWWHRLNRAVYTVDAHAVLAELCTCLLRDRQGRQGPPSTYICNILKPDLKQRTCMPRTRCYESSLLTTLRKKTHLMGLPGPRQNCWILELISARRVNYMSFHREESTPTWSQTCHSKHTATRGAASCRPGNLRLRKLPSGARASNFDLLLAK